MVESECGGKRAGFAVASVSESGVAEVRMEGGCGWGGAGGRAGCGAGDTVGGVGEGV